MKILMALMGLEIGGAETHVVELAKELNKRGHTVVIASNGGVYVEPLEQLGIRHFEIPMHRREPRTMLMALKMMEKLIREEKPDLVHAHARIPAFLCGILHKKMKFPFITSAHWVFEVTPLLRLMTDWGERTVAVSEDIKEYLKENYRLPENQIHVTINGIDTEAFGPVVEDAAFRKEIGLGDGPVVCTVSRLDKSREEASRQLIALTPALVERIPNAQVLIVGGGDQEEELRRNAEEINCVLGRDAIIMTGARTDISRLVALGDVFVGVSRAALEAMAAEKPTILAGNEGYIGIFSPDKLDAARESNFCCRGFQPISLARLLGDILTLLDCDERERCEIGRFGRQVVLNEYSVARMTNDYLNAYHRLLQKPINAVISGYYGYGNLGDDAILIAISRQLKERELPVALTVLSRKPEATEKEYGIRAVHRFLPWAVLRALKGCDILISGGGSLLQDRTSTRSLLYYLAVIRLAKFMRKPVFLFANGIGPITRPANRKRVRRSLKYCDMITLRDEESLGTLYDLGLETQGIHVTGDPAFSLKGKGQGKFYLQNCGVPVEGNLVGVSARSVSGQEGFSQELASFCDRLVREQQKTVVFFVMQASEDEEFSRQIQGLMEERSYLVKTPGEPEKMLAILHEMDILVSMRLHTIIFAAVEGVPTLGCIYDPKVSALLRMLDMPSCGAPEDFRAEEAYSKAEQMLSMREEKQRELERRMEILRPKSRETILLLEKLLRERGLI